MLRKIFNFFLKRSLLKKYYEEKAEKIMKEYLKEDKTCIGIYDKKGKLKTIKKAKGGK